MKATITCYISLMLLLGLTLFISTFSLGKWNMAAGLFIATLKAGLIISIFMDAKKSRAYFFVIGGLLLFLATIFVLTMADFFTRTRFY